MRKHLWIVVTYLTVLLVGCTDVNLVDYTVPDNYEGFLTIYYECPGGVPVNSTEGRLHIIFNSRGVACVKERYSTLFAGGITHTSSVRTFSGKSIHFAGGWEQMSTGYALLDLSVQQRQGPNNNSNIPRYTNSILWLGEMQQLAELYQSNQYSEQLASFLEHNAGIPRAGAKSPP